MKDFKLRELIYIIGIGFILASYYFKIENRQNLTDQRVDYIEENYRMMLKQGEFFKN